MSTETTNKKIKIDNGTTFGRTYTDKAVDEMLKNVGGKLDIVKVTYNPTNSKVTADIANKPDGTYVADLILKMDDAEVNLGTKIGLIEIGSLVDIDSGFTFRTLSGYGYLNDLMFLHGVGSATDTTIDITGGTPAYIPTNYTINGLVKIQSDGTLGGVTLPNQGQSDSFLVYDTTVGNYVWRPVSHGFDMTQPFGKTNSVRIGTEFSTEDWTLKRSDTEIELSTEDANKARRILLKAINYGFVAYVDSSNVDLPNIYGALVNVLKTDRTIFATFALNMALPIKLGYLVIYLTSEDGKWKYRCFNDEAEDKAKRLKELDK